MPWEVGQRKKKAHSSVNPMDQQLTKNIIRHRQYGDDGKS